MADIVLVVALMIVAIGITLSLLGFKVWHDAVDYIDKKERNREE